MSFIEPTKIFVLPLDKQVHISLKTRLRQSDKAEALQVMAAMD